MKNWWNNLHWMNKAAVIMSLLSIAMSIASIIMMALAAMRANMGL